MVFRRVVLPAPVPPLTTMFARADTIQRSSAATAGAAKSSSRRTQARNRRMIR